MQKLESVLVALFDISRNIERIASAMEASNKNTEEILKLIRADLDAYKKTLEGKSEDFYD